MFSLHPRFAKPKVTLTSRPSIAASAPRSAVGTAPSASDISTHTDYNLQPLGIRQSEHYTSQPRHGERFLVH